VPPACPPACPVWQPAWGKNDGGLFGGLLSAWPAYRGFWRRHSNFKMTHRHFLNGDLQPLPFLGIEGTFLQLWGVGAFFGLFRGKLY